MSRRDGTLVTDLRRVFSQLFRPAAPAATTAADLADRIAIAADILARDLSEDPSLGFPWKTRTDLLPVARRLAWMRWRYETGRLTEPMAGTPPGAAATANKDVT